jgi:hypothetical protein
MVNKNMKKYSAPAVIKTTLGFYLTPGRVTIIKKTKQQMPTRMQGERNTYSPLLGNVN